MCQREKEYEVIEKIYYLKDNLEISNTSFRIAGFSLIYVL